MTWVNTDGARPVKLGKTMAADQDNSETGLRTVQARTRLALDGPNEVAQATRRSFCKRLADMLRQPMFALLVTAATLYVVLGASRRATWWWGTACC